MRLYDLVHEDTLQAHPGRRHGQPAAADRLRWHIRVHLDHRSGAADADPRTAGFRYGVRDAERHADAVSGV